MSRNPLPDGALSLAAGRISIACEPGPLALSEITAGAVRSAPTRGRTVDRAGASSRLGNPALLFTAVSLFAGALLAVITPPLRGPDEAQHFLRAYGITQGDLVPRSLDLKGRKGLYIPARLERELAFFESKRYAYRTPGFTYWSIFAAHAQDVTPPADADATVFIPYGGAEGYSPVPYLPYLAAIAIGRAAHLDFLAMLYLMRAFGLVTVTAISAFAIMLVPRLQWAFLTIALLPAALYSRAVVSADGPSLACAMMAVALITRGVLAPAADRPGRQSLWLALGALTKPPQLALVLLEVMKLPCRWKSAAVAVLPAVILAGVWTLAGGADAASYRLSDFMDVRPEEFDPIWKLGYMLHDPLLFPTLLMKSFIDYGVPLWHQLIGVLNWLDTPLAGWTYPVLTALLLACLFGPLGVDRATGRRVALASALAVAGYCFAVFFIFFLVWTALNATQIDGVQGRYFVPALPALALGTAALVRRGLSEKIRAAIALSAAVLSCAAAFEAVLRVDWNW
jgi:Predicted membrane protein (DUF2142)